jgi:hypothetical protein
MMKTSAEAFKHYRDWQRYILGTYPDLPAGRKRITLIAYCMVLASHGTNGLDCWLPNGKIAKEIGIGLDTVVTYRKLALALGWIAYTGGHHGRVLDVSIAIPKVVEHKPPTLSVVTYEDEPDLDRLKAQWHKRDAGIATVADEDVPDQSDPWAM